MKSIQQHKMVWLIIAFALPILALLANVGLQYWHRINGVEVILPIEGYDPRNLLSGHYVTYRIKYNPSKSVCQHNTQGKQTLCFTKTGNQWHGTLVDTTVSPSPNCALTLNGFCENGRFRAGIEKFFIPQEYAGKLDQAVRAKKGEIVISIDPFGQAVIKDLRLEGQSWRDYVKK